MELEKVIRLAWDNASFQGSFARGFEHNSYGSATSWVTQSLYYGPPSEGQFKNFEGQLIRIIL